MSPLPPTSGPLGTVVAVFMFLGAPAHADEAPPSDDGTGVTVDAADDSATEVPPTDEEQPAFDPTDPEQIHRDIVFPVVGSASYWQDFGACRDGCTRPHEGTDIMTHGWKGVPVVAAHDGVIVWARIGGPLAGCAVVIEAPDGWSSVYSHLNTDLPGTDLDESPCFAPGIGIGASVRAGTLIGWVGDAGNAEETPPHLHFEIHHPDGIPVDPWVSLVDARRIDHRWVDAADLTAMAPSMASVEATTVYVVATDDLVDLARTSDTAVALDAPLVAYDPSEPAIAAAAIIDLAPDRIVVLADSSDVPFLEELRPLAAIIGVGRLTPPPEPVPSLDDSVVLDGAEEPAEIDGEAEDSARPGVPDGFTAVDDLHVTVLAGGKPDSRWALDPLTEGHQIIILSGKRPDPTIGADGLDHPGPNANRDGLWWRTADGWRLTTSEEDAPERDLAYLVRSDVDPSSLAFLSSLAQAPPMPLWHYQPTSRTTRSL